MCWLNQTGYVIPSNKLLTANDGRLELSPRAPKGEKNMPIDVFQFTGRGSPEPGDRRGFIRDRKRWHPGLRRSKSMEALHSPRNHSLVNIPEALRN